MGQEALVVVSNARDSTQGAAKVAEAWPSTSRCARAGRGLAKRSLANAALTMGSVVLMMALVLSVEWAYRLSKPRYLDGFSLDDMSYLHTYSEAYGWAPRPGFRSATGQGPKTSINSAGYRGGEYPEWRLPGKKRVLMLGDSIAFGYGVADEETSSRQLEELDPEFEVVNLAVQGYGTDQALLRFEQEGLRFRPDAAILNFCLANDFRDNGATRAIYDGAFPKPYFTLDGGTLTEHRDGLGLSAFARLGLFLHQRSVVFNALQRLATVAGGRQATPPAEHPPDREVTFALLRQFGETARAHNIKLIVAVYPTYREFLKPSRKAKLVLEATRPGDVVGVDLRPLLEGRGVNRDTYAQYAMDGSFHLTPRGHRIVAEILLDVLNETLQQRPRRDRCDWRRSEPGRTR
jgi:GDSL-like Lipase/Acylhydrolase family